MNSSRPYLIRALYEWITDNGLTPYILLNAEDEATNVPQQFVEDGKIVLNINPGAVQNLDLGNHYVELDARFSGASHHVVAPIRAVMAIYARENGKGMVFADDEEGDEPPPSPPEDNGNKKPALRVVK